MIDQKDRQLKCWPRRSRQEGEAEFGGTGEVEWEMGNGEGREGRRNGGRGKGEGTVSGDDGVDVEVC